MVRVVGANDRAGEAVIVSGFVAVRYTADENNAAARMRNLICLVDSLSVWFIPSALASRGFVVDGGSFHRISRRWTNWSSSVSLRSETAQKAIPVWVQ